LQSDRAINTLPTSATQDSTIILLYIVLSCVADVVSLYNVGKYYGANKYVLSPRGGRDFNIGERAPTSPRRTDAYRLSPSQSHPH